MGCFVPASVASPEQRPRTHYQLLGISADERDPAVIEAWAVRLAGQVRAHQLTREPECTRLLGAIAGALVTLLDPVQRAAYDRGLGQPSDPAVAGPRPAPPPPRAPQDLVLVPVPGKMTAPRSCDVELVCRA
jgi:hypothetical protein